MRKLKGMNTSGVNKRGGFKTGGRTETMAWVKTGNAMVTQKQNQIAKEWYFSLSKSVHRETDLRVFSVVGVSSGALRSPISASESILLGVEVRWRERRARKRKRLMPETKVAVRKYTNADFGEAVSSSEGTRSTEAISRGEVSSWRVSGFGYGGHTSYGGKHSGNSLTSIHTPKSVSRPSAVSSSGKRNARHDSLHARTAKCIHKRKHPILAQSSAPATHKHTSQHYNNIALRSHNEENCRKGEDAGQGDVHDQGHGYTCWIIRVVLSEREVPGGGKIRDRRGGQDQRLEVVKQKVIICKTALKVGGTGHEHVPAPEPVHGELYSYILLLHHRGAKRKEGLHSTSEQQKYGIFKL